MLVDILIMPFAGIFSIIAVPLLVVLPISTPKIEKIFYSLKYRKLSTPQGRILRRWGGWVFYLAIESLTIPYVKALRYLILGFRHQDKTSNS